MSDHGPSGKLERSLWRLEKTMHEGAHSLRRARQAIANLRSSKQLEEAMVIGEVDGIEQHINASNHALDDLAVRLMAVWKG